MKYNFDEIIPREETRATKSYVTHVALNHPNCVNLWVADMDFPVCREINEALVQRAKHPIYGYTEKSEDVKEAIKGWFARRHDIHFTCDEVVLNTGVVYGYSAAIRILSDVNDEILIPIPAYAPFVRKAEANRRIPVFTQLKSAEENFALDFEDMEKKVTEKTKIFVLCNPHNPSGRVYTKEELIEIAAFCEKHHLMILSDEIHCDIIYKKFTTIMDVSEYAKNNTIALRSVAKSFNLAGLKMAAAVIKNPDLRESFIKESECVGNASINCFAFEAFRAAYNHADDWMDQCLAYMRNNIEWTRKTFADKFPKLHIADPDGTYFIWIDLESFHIKTDDIQQYFLEEADVYVTQGEFFGAPYKEYIRLNMATQFQNVKKGVESICRVLQSIG